MGQFQFLIKKKIFIQMSSRDCVQTTNSMSANNASNISNVRLIDNSDTIDRIAQLTTPQITNNSFGNNLFNGTSFNDDNSFVSLILPAGV